MNSGPGSSDSGPIQRAEFRFDQSGWRTYGPSVSPDGSAFAYIVDDGRGYPRAAQRALTVDGVEELRWVRIPASGPVRKLVHSTDGRWLAVEVAPRGGEHHQVWAVTTDPDDDTAYRLGAERTTGRGFATVSLVRWDADWVLLTATEPDGTAHSLRVHPARGITEVLDVRVGGALIDSWKGATLLRVGPRGYRDMLLLRRPADRPDDDAEITALLPNDPGAVSSLGHILDQGFEHHSLVFAGAPRPGERDLDSVQALVVSDFDAKFSRLLGIEVDKGGVRFRVLATRPDSDIDEFVVSNDQSTVAILWNVNGYSELQILSLPERTLHDPIPLPGAVAADLSISAAGTLVALSISSPQRSPLVHLVNTRTGVVTPINDDAVIGEGPSSALRPELCEFSARDGMPLSGWLFRARDAPDAPTVIYFHGGPEGQTRPDYNFLFGPLVDAGITVFAPNVRGSSGYGRLFSHADDRYGRYAGIDDAADCAKYLSDSGIADPDRLYVSGRSYGGYLTLACLTFHPDLFAAGIAICGMSDLESFYRNTEAWIGLAAYTKYGNPESDRELLRDLSPIHRIGDVRAPLLVIHGAHDTNVPVSESQQIVDELRARGRVAELLLFPDEGHEIVTRDNQLALAEAVAGWVLAHPKRPQPGDIQDRDHDGFSLPDPGVSTHQ